METKVATEKVEVVWGALVQDVQAMYWLFFSVKEMDRHCVGFELWKKGSLITWKEYGIHWNEYQPKRGKHSYARGWW